MSGVIHRLEAAIKAKDTAAYTKAYADLTASCNACHQSDGHPEIVIQLPTVSFFPDQDFRPQKCCTGVNVVGVICWFTGWLLGIAVLPLDPQALVAMLRPHPSD